MIYRSGYFAGAIFAWCLWIGGKSLATAAHQQRGCHVALLRLWYEQGELQHDEEVFESDINSLRRMLRRHASPGRIARLRGLVHQDWTQIIMDREPSGICQAEPAAYLAAQRDN